MKNRDNITPNFGSFFIMMISILSWNIRGLGSREKKAVIRDLVAKSKANICML